MTRLRIDTKRMASLAAWAGRKLTQLILTLTAPLWRHALFVLVALALNALCAWRQTSYSIEPLRLASLLWVDLYAAGLLLCALRGRWRVWVRRGLYVLLYLLAGIELFLWERFEMVYSPTALQLLSETTWRETSEFFGAYLWSGALLRTVLMLGGVALAHFAAARWARRAWELLEVDFLPKLAIAIALLCLTVGSVADTWSARGKLFDFFAERTSQQVENVIWQDFYSPWHRLGYSVKMRSLAQEELVWLKQRMAATLRVDSCSARVPTLVLVIGESHNKHHSQLYGYRRLTAEWQLSELKARRLVAFRDVVTPWNLTSNVFKHLMSTHSVDDEGGSNRWWDGVLWPAVFRRAGYRVTFYTNQYVGRRTDEGFDFNGSFFLNDAQLDTLCFDARNTEAFALDRDLVADFAQHADTTSCKPQLYIFHLYGQHQQYRCRVPEGAAYYTGDSIQRRNALNAAQKQTLAEYDNATRENDRVLRSICQLFAHRDALVLYVADHGEQVYDRSLIVGRTNQERIIPLVARNEYEVPMTLWFSPLALQRHPDIYDAAWMSAARPFMTDDLCHLLFGLAGIHCPQYRPQRDLLHPGFDIRRRRLLKGVCDYEQTLEGSDYKPGQN